MKDAGAPWDLFGEAIVARVKIPSRQALVLPKGVRRIRGMPAVVYAEHFSSSPFGEFLSFIVAVPARVGARPGVSVSVAAVSSEQVRLGTRNNWRFPTELADLRWGSFGRERELSWAERGIVIRGTPASVPFPFAFRFRTLQRDEHGIGVTPVLLRGLLRRAEVVMDVAEDDPLVWLRGNHRGFYFSSNRVRLNQLRTPLGIFSTLRAPLTPNPRLRPGQVN